MRTRPASTAAEGLTPTAASLLGFLHEGPLSGWDLLAKAELTIGDFWNITKSQVYRELDSLASSGLVTLRKIGARARRPYAITAAGRAAFASWLSQEPGPLLMRWPLALTIYFGKHLDEGALPAMLATHRRHHQATLENLRSFLPAFQAAADWQAGAVLDLGIRFHSMTIEWIDSLSRASQPAKRRPGR